MTARDNWGWQARIGIFIVGNEAVPEAEWWAMAPPNVSVHAARVTARSPWPLDGDLERGARQFAAMKLDAVTLGRFRQRRDKTQRVGIMRDRLLHRETAQVTLAGAPPILNRLFVLTGSLELLR